MSLQQLVDSAFGHSGKQMRNGEVMYFCKVCHHGKPKLSVNLNTESNSFGCWHCWVCGNSHITKGNSLFGLFRHLKAESLISQLKSYVKEKVKTTDSIEDKIEVRLPREFKSLAIKQKDFKYAHAMKYLKSRQVDMKTILKYNIGYCADGQYANRIIIPSYDSDAHLNYFIARTWIKDNSMRYMNPPVSKNVTAFELFVNWKYDITLCEGFFDAIQIRRNSIPLLGKSIPSDLKSNLISNCPPMVNICLDLDAKSDAFEVCNFLSNHGIRCKLVNLSGKDPADIGYSEIWKLINKSKEFLPSDYLRYRILQQ